MDTMTVATTILHAFFRIQVRGAIPFGNFRGMDICLAPPLRSYATHLSHLRISVPIDAAWSILPHWRW
jgi:hypothetical protein